MIETSLTSFARRLNRLNKNSTKILINEVGLNKDYKNVLYKKYVEEKSLVEIANELGYTKETVNNLISKSRRVLEDIILEQYELMPIKLQMISDYLYEL